MASSNDRLVNLSTRTEVGDGPIVGFVVNAHAFPVSGANGAKGDALADVYDVGTLDKP